MNQPKTDRARDFINKFYDQNYNSRRYVSLTIHQYRKLKLITTTVGDKHDARLYRDGMEEYTYWLTAEERQPLIAEMMKAGIKRPVIARMLKFAPATIYRDVAYMRACTTLLDGIEFPTRRPKAVVRPTRSRSTVSTSITLQ